MPLLSVYVDEEIYKKIQELVAKQVFPDESTAILTAFKLLIHVVEFCKSRNIPEEECVDEVVRHIFKLMI